MKRHALLLSLAGVMLLALAAAGITANTPAWAKGKPTTTTTQPTGLSPCGFGTLEGSEGGDVVLHYQDNGEWTMWNGDEPLWCDFDVSTLADAEPYLPTRGLRFAIEALNAEGSFDAEGSFVGPYLVIKEEHPGSDICYRDQYNGKQTGSVEFPIDPDAAIVLPNVDSATGGQCPPWAGVSPDLDGPFIFTITVYVTKGGPVWLRLLP